MTGLIFIALILIGLAYALMLFYRGLLDPDEGRYAEIAREMVTTGHWGKMRLLGYRYYEKPPLTYWLLASAIKACGATAAAVRIPLLINILLVIGLLHALIRKRWAKLLRLQTLLVIVSSLGFFIGFSLLITDGFLAFFFSLTCILLFMAFQPAAPGHHRPLYLLLATLAAVLGFLVKGAVAAVLPIIILVLWLLWERRGRELLNPYVLMAGLLFLAILRPLLVWLEQHNSGFLMAFIFDEHIARFTGARLSQLHAEPFWFYAAVLPLLLLPWTLFIVRAARNIIRQGLLASDCLTRFFLVWIVVVLAFFSAASGKLITYILPALPPLLLLLGRWGLAEPLDGSRWDRRLWILGATGSWGIVPIIILAWAVSFWQLAPSLGPALSLASLVALTPLTLALVIFLALKGFKHLPGLIFLNAALLFNVALLLSPLAGNELKTLFKVNSAPLYQDLAQRLKPEDQLLVFGTHRPSLPFYTGQLPYICHGMNELKYGILKERQRPHYLWTQADIRRLVQACPGRVYVLVAAKDYQKKFLPLGLHCQSTDFHNDPNTIVLELLPI